MRLGKASPLPAAGRPSAEGALTVPASASVEAKSSESSRQTVPPASAPAVAKPANADLSESAPSPVSADASMTVIVLDELAVGGAVLEVAAGQRVMQRRVTVRWNLTRSDLLGDVSACVFSRWSSTLCSQLVAASLSGCPSPPLPPQEETMVHGKRKVTPLPPVPATPVKKKRADFGATQSNGAPVSSLSALQSPAASPASSRSSSKRAPAWCGWSWQ